MVLWETYLLPDCMIALPLGYQGFWHGTHRRQNAVCNGVLSLCFPRVGSSGASDDCCGCEAPAYPGTAGVPLGVRNRALQSVLPLRATQEGKGRAQGEGRTRFDSEWQEYEGAEREKAFRRFRGGSLQ